MNASQSIVVKKPTCSHIFLYQQTHSCLPDLYIAEPLSAKAIGYLQRTILYLEQPRPASTNHIKQIRNLRHELRQGMSKQRRQEVYNYVLSIKDVEKRAATEMYLARYPGFVLNGHGKLMFGDGDGLPMVYENFNRGDGDMICSIM